MHKVAFALDAHQVFELDDGSLREVPPFDDIHDVFLGQATIVLGAYVFGGRHKLFVAIPHILMPIIPEMRHVIPIEFLVTNPTWIDINPPPALLITAPGAGYVMEHDLRLFTESITLIGVVDNHRCTGI